MWLDVKIGSDARSTKIQAARCPIAVLTVTESPKTVESQRTNLRTLYGIGLFPNITIVIT
jgi:hypothetical protein